jgi:hypothetical protein
MYPEGIILQPELYDNLMDALQRDCRVLESFRIMDYSLLIGIHNLDTASKEDEEDKMDGVVPAAGGGGVANAAASAASFVSAGPSRTRPPLLNQASTLTADTSFGLERQGSGRFKPSSTIAHSTALESITALSADGGSSTSGVDEEALPGRSSASSRCNSIVDEDIGFPTATGKDETDEGSVVKNVWGGIPACNHRGERILLFIGIIDILQSYGALKKAEHYWKSLVTRGEGDTVSVHRPAFYARRFQGFMKDKVFRPTPPPPQPPSASGGAGGVGVPFRSSFRRSHFRRATSKGEESAAAASAAGETPGDGPPVRGVQDPPSSAAVTVIRIGEGDGDGDNGIADEVNLPAVLQDRRKKPPTPSSPTAAVPPFFAVTPAPAGALGPDRRVSSSTRTASMSLAAPSSSSPEPSSTGKFTFLFALILMKIEGGRCVTAIYVLFLSPQLEPATLQVFNEAVRCF